MFKVDLKKRREAILNGNLLKALTMLSVPVIMMGMVGSLIPLSDAWFSSNLLGPDVFGAISYSQPSINIIIALSQGLGVAAMAIVGKIVGQGDVEKVKKVSLQIIIWGIILSFLLIPVTFLFAEIVSKTAVPEMQNNVYRYISLTTIILPFYFMAAIFNAIKNVTGNPEASLYRMLFLFVSKLIFNYIFLYIMRMDIAGTRYSSLAAYLITGIWMYYDLFLKDSLYKLDLKGYKFDYKIVKEVTIIGIPAMLNLIMINLGFFFINLEVVKYGADVVTGLGIASQINTLCFILPSNIAVAVTTMVSMNVGYNQVKKAKDSYKLATKIALLISVIMLFIFIPYSKFFISFFTSQAGIIKVADEALQTYTYTVIPFSIFIVANGVLNALGRTNITMFLGILRFWLIRYIFILITEKYLGYYSVFYGNLISNIIGAIIIVIILSKIQWKSVIDLS